MQRLSPTVTAISVAILLAACDHRASESALYGTWQIKDGCIDCTHFVSLQPNHNVLGFSDALGRENWIDYRGRWYAGGQVLVIHHDNEEQAGSTVMRIIEVTSDTLRLRMSGSEVVWKR